MNILGISAYYHDSAAALIQDGNISAAAQEERFSRRKHDSGFPVHAIDFCLRQGNIEISDLDYVVFYEKPLRKFERLLETYMAFAPAGIDSFSKALPVWLKEKLFISNDIRKHLGGKKLKAKLVFTEHHESHGASAFYPSPFEEAAVLTVDGVGEWATASIGYGKGNRFQILKTLRFPHSLGMLYSAFTYFTGFKVNSGEYKLMGLAPYGHPVYADLIREKLVHIHDDGSLELDMKYFNYCQGLTMTSQAFSDLFGGPPRKPESAISQREMDLAASIQEVTAEIMLKMAVEAKRLTGSANLCMAGGCALNCAANGFLTAKHLFDRIWVQPAAGDAGGALGCALFVYYHLLERERKCTGHDFQHGSLLGNAYTNDEIRRYLDEQNIVYEYHNDDELMPLVSRYLAEGKVVGWFQGRMEFGPRALGARSILGDPRNPEMQKRMNMKIKFRESFRPFAPAVLAEDAAEFFDFQDESPYMLFTAPVRQAKRRPLSSEEETIMRNAENLNDRLKILRSELPAITHLDYSARLQTVDRERNPRFRRLLESFKELTGCPVLVNTSFNIRGEPIVCTPENACTCFFHTDMDILVMENHILKKDPNAKPADRESYLKRYELD